MCVEEVWQLFRDENYVVSSCDGLMSFRCGKAFVLEAANEHLELGMSCVVECLYHVLSFFSRFMSFDLFFVAQKIEKLFS